MKIVLNLLVSFNNFNYYSVHTKFIHEETMQEGVFALIDCLGFKGIWRKNENKDLVLKKLTRIEKEAKREAKLLMSKLNTLSAPSEPDLQVEIVMLSDTIAVSVPYVNTNQINEIETIRKGHSIETALLITANFLKLFMLDEPFLSLRGCITYGEHSIKKNFLVGPAVDEAAEHYEIADGAFVWIHPNLLKPYESYIEQKMKMGSTFLSLINNNKIQNPITSQMKIEDLTWLVEQNPHIPIIFEHDLPLKTGKKIISSVVNPLFFFHSGEERAKIIFNYLKSFESNKIDVLIKRQNTMELLAEADKKCENFDYDSLFKNESLQKLFGTKEKLK